MPGLLEIAEQIVHTSITFALSRMHPIRFFLRLSAPLAILAIALCLTTRAYAAGGFDANGQCVGDQDGDGKEVPLTLDQDGIWQHADLTMLDFENKVQPCNAEGTTLTNTVIRGVVAPATYTGVRFRLGVPFDMDHQNEATAPSPLNLTGM